jgi:hypothetical protein
MPDTSACRRAVPAALQYWTCRRIPLPAGMHSILDSCGSCPGMPRAAGSQCLPACIFSSASIVYTVPAARFDCLPLHVLVAEFQRLLACTELPLVVTILSQPVLRIRISLLRIRILLFTLMRIWILPFTLMRIRILLFTFIRVRILLLTLMRIQIRNTGPCQHA